MERYEARPEGNHYVIFDRFTGKTAVTSDAEPEAICERVDRMNAKFNQILEVANRVTDTVNTIGDDPAQDFALAMSRQHRTLQQGFTRMCVAWLEHLAKLNENEFDLRNADSVRLAKTVIGSEKWQDVKYLSHV